MDATFAHAKPDGTPGDYVVLSVTDSGIGMPARMLDKVFDPFFTTKAVGQGSGIGLFMVYGFDKQSGGHVEIHSRVDESTIACCPHGRPRLIARDRVLSQPGRVWVALTELDSPRLVSGPRESRSPCGGDAGECRPRSLHRPGEICRSTFHAHSRDAVSLGTEHDDVRPVRALHSYPSSGCAKSVEMGASPHLE